MSYINLLSIEEVFCIVLGVNIVGDMGLFNCLNISIWGFWGRWFKKVLLMEDGFFVVLVFYIVLGVYYNLVSDWLIFIEVYKGVDLLWFGLNNMYGVVNYIIVLLF